MQLRENVKFANRYELLKLLGRGGFSEVWLAKDDLTGLDVAIKVYAPGQGLDDDGLHIFSKELARVYDLNHSNLLKPQHVDSWENMPYLIMSYCSAGSCVKKVGNMSEDDMWKLIKDVSAGLAYLHSKDIIHQDIKPDNILVNDAGNYLLTDFGVSTRARSTLRKSMSSMTSGGTTAYMGPERFSKQPAAIKASDIWSLGAMCFELLEGDVPFGQLGGGMQKCGADIPIINANVSYALKNVIYQMLQPNPWNRPTAEKLQRGDTVVHIDNSSNNIHKPKRPWLWMSIAAVFLVIIAIVSVVNVYHVDDEPKVNQYKVYKSDNPIVVETSVVEEQVEECTPSIKLSAERKDDMILQDTDGVVDGCGNEYKAIVIGSQYWLNKNIACNKYASGSEKSGQTIAYGSNDGSHAYYVNASNVEAGSNNGGKNYASYLSEKDRRSLGYLYSWAAAMGYSYNKNENLYAKRQGVCPNGWHVPLVSEWEELIDYLGIDSGKKLKSKSGWFDKGNGVDRFGFCALPAGTANGSKVYQVGRSANWWSGTQYNEEKASGYNISYGSNNLQHFIDLKSDAQSVRCVKD